MASNNGTYMRLARDLFDRVRALWSFLAIPLGVVALFLILAAVTYKLDSAITTKLVHKWGVLQALEDVFGDRQSTRNLLATIASALITVTSITFSLLLVAVQQAAASFSNQILDQFRKRRMNQFFFGFFVGLSLYTLLTLATTRALHHPLVGALLSIILTVVALLMMLVLIYTTIEQMRGSNVIDAIATIVGDARNTEVPVLERTRRHPNRDLQWKHVHACEQSGTVATVKIDDICKAVDERDECEVVISATIGTYVGTGDPLFEIRRRSAMESESLEALVAAVEPAIVVTGDSQLDTDPKKGLQQLATIAWNSTSTAISNPRPPELVIRAVRELVATWSECSPKADEKSRVVYPDDTVEQALALLESTAVASAESRQPQTLAEIYDAYAVLLPRLNTAFRAQVEGAIRLSLGALPMHFPTQRLNRSMRHLAEVLDNEDSTVAQLVRTVLREERHDGRFAADALEKA